jgi:acyl-CoA thioester hydrolase
VPFEISVTVQPSDIDYLGHVSNLVYLRWVQEIAIQHTTALGLAAEDYLAMGKAWVVRKHEIEYLRAAKSGDVITLQTRVASMSVASSVRKTRVFRGTEELCRASTDWVFVDLLRERPTRIPPEVMARFPLEP